MARTSRKPKAKSVSSATGSTIQRAASNTSKLQPKSSGAARHVQASVSSSSTMQSPQAMKQLGEELKHIAKRPGLVLHPEDSKQVVARVKELCKPIFAKLAKQLGGEAPYALDTLVSEGMDAEQIWAQVRLLVEPSVKCSTRLEASCNVNDDSLELLGEEDQEEGSCNDDSGDNGVQLGTQSSDSEGDSDDMKNIHQLGENEEEASSESDEKDSEDDESQTLGHNGVGVATKKKFDIDAELRRSVAMSEKADGYEGYATGSSDEGLSGEEDSDDEDGAGLFGDDDDDNSNDGGLFGDDIKSKEAKFSDFFDEEGMAADGEADPLFRDIDDDEGDADDVDEQQDDDDEGDDVFGEAPLSELSELAKRKEKLEEEIRQLETDALKDKEWQMTGEVTSKKRPHNSLLAEALEFERIAQPAPQPTEEKAEEIEDLIKKRVQEGLFDDVIRKLAPTEKENKEEELDFEKSQKGLGEEYADDYASAVLGAQGGVNVEELRQALIDQWNELSRRLDALSNFHFTPKPVVREATIRSDVPAIQLEEVVPLTAATTSDVAAETLQAKQLTTRQLKSETELTKEERKRRRAQAKRISKKKRLEKDAQRQAAGMPLSAIQSGVGKQSKEGKSTKQKAQERAQQEDSHVDYAKTTSLFAKLQAEANGTAPSRSKQRKHAKTSGGVGATFKM